MNRSVANVKVNTAIGAVMYKDVPIEKMQTHEGALKIVTIDDDKVGQEVWFGPGIWHTATIDVQRYDD